MTNCPKCDKELWGMEYGYPNPEEYDGISEWFCNKDAGGCGYRVGRWTKQELKDDEIESVYGERGVIKYEEGKQ